MADDFSLTDALSGSSQAPSQKSEGGQVWPGAPWGGQNPPAGQQYPGAPGGQQYPGAPGGPQYQGYPGAPAGQPFPGYPGAPAGQQYPGAPAGQQYPGYPGAPAGQQYPGAPAGQQYPGYPGAPADQQYPGFPGFPSAGQGGPGQPFPGFPNPGAPTPGQPGPSAPTPTAPTAPGFPAPTGPVRVPFDLPLPNGAVNRLLITIQGTVNQAAKRFNFDFRRGRDIAFHCNPRFDESQRVIVCNSFIRGEWGKEERETSKFPFKQGQPFKIQFICEPELFGVGVNNETVCKFRHRVRELSEIKSMGICGDITVADISISMA